MSRSSSGARPQPVSASPRRAAPTPPDNSSSAPAHGRRSCSPKFAIPITIERQVLYWFDPRGGTAPFVNHPIFIHEDAAGMQVYGFPAIDGPGGGVKVAFFRKGIVCTPETIDRTVHDQEIAEMREGVARAAARPGRAVPARGDLHVLQHPRRKFRHRPPPGFREHHRCMRILRPRFQVRPRGRRDPRRPRRRRWRPAIPFHCSTRSDW